MNLHLQSSQPSTFSHLPSDDSALVQVFTPFSVTWLREFCRDVERLYRINPMLEFVEWRQLDAQTYYMRARNLSNDQEIDTEIHVEEIDSGLKITYAKGLKRTTWVKIEAYAQGTTLIIADDYSGLSVAERKRHLAKIDHSLESWGRELYRYFQYWKRWSWFPPFRWYTRYLWLKMKPTARRVAYMLIIISLFEIVVLLGVVGFFVLF